MAPDGKLLTLARGKAGRMSTDWHALWARLEGAYAAGTLRCYRSDTAVFCAWCAERELTPFPASPAVVRSFLDSRAPHLSAATRRRRLAALRKAHALLELPDPMAAEVNRLALRRVLRGKCARPRQAKGMTQCHLEAFLAVQPDTPWGLRNRAMLALG
jgi:site-specific recombinase XerD